MSSKNCFQELQILIYKLGAMSSLVASAWLDKDLKYTLRFVSKSVFGFLATIALVLRTVEWSNYKDREPKMCQNICIPDGTVKNPVDPDFDAEDHDLCDNQDLALSKGLAGHSSLFFLTISLVLGSSTNFIKQFHF